MCVWGGGAFFASVISPPLFQVMWEVEKKEMEDGRSRIEI